MTEPKWLERARRDLGERETLGANDSPRIRAILKRFSWQWLTGQPWCGSILADWMTDCGYTPPKNAFRARAWLAWGEEILGPAVGAVVVFEREGGGHVGIIVGKDSRGRLLVIGGNQSNAVTIAAFEMQRALGYRLPVGELSTAALPLPVLASAGASSTNEA